MAYSKCVTLDTASLLWFKASNSYVLVSEKIKQLIDSYLNGDETLDELLTQELKAFLAQCKTPRTHSEIITELPTITSAISTYFQIADKCIRVDFDKECYPLFYPMIQSYAVEERAAVDAFFSISKRADVISITDDGENSYSNTIDHIRTLFGKFNYFLLRKVHEINGDLTATLHGSAAIINDTPLLFMGKSGSGKSTFAALLALNGYSFISDDMIPFDGKANKMYWNPSQPSIKIGSREIIRQFEASFEIDRSKEIQYLALNAPKQTWVHMSKKVVLIKYDADADAETTISKATAEEVAQILIEDSWICADETHASYFLSWLESIEAYHLRYSNFESAVEALKSNLC